MRFITALKLVLVGGGAGIAALVLAATTSTPPPAQATPDGVIALNSGICLTLGIAFGGIPAQNSLLDCSQMPLQNGAQSFQDYLHCLRGVCGMKTDANGVPFADQTAGGPVGLPIRGTPDDFAALDRDQNQVHEGQYLVIIAFVNDDKQVRFDTDVGLWAGVGTQTYTCDSDPDCDGVNGTDPATDIGDGVVSAILLIGDPAKPEEKSPTGPGRITVVQENVGYTLDFTVVGKPETITLSPLFGKDTIAVGATPPTVTTPIDPDVEPQLPRETDCNFEGTVSGVLGANNQAEKAVVIAKVLDNDGNEVVGSLLNWTHPIAPSKELPGTTVFGPTDQGGVALPQTPTLDLGSGIGIGFPQFVCGLLKPGLFKDTVTLSTLVDTTAAVAPGSGAKAELVMKVVDAPASITLTADPAQIDCNGTNTSKVTATVTTKDGDPVANGTDVNFSTVAFGTANPLKADSSGGSASTTVTPLAGAGTLGPKGVTVSTSVRGKRTNSLYLPGAPGIEKPGNIATPVDELFNLDPEYDTVENSILVACSGSLGPGAEQAGGAGAAPGGAAAPSGAIRAPDTGTGGAAAPGGLGWPLLIALPLAGVLLGGARLVLRRTG